MQSNLLDAVRQQPLAILGLIMIDHDTVHFQSCLECCNAIQSDAKEPGRILAIIHGESKDTSVEAYLRSNQNIAFIQWRSAADSIALAKKISEIKRVHQWGIVVMGTLGSPWTESIGRLCDKTYLSIPSSSKHSFAKIRKDILRLRNASVQIAGSYIARSAA